MLKNEEFFQSRGAKDIMVVTRRGKRTSDLSIVEPGEKKRSTRRSRSRPSKPSKLQRQGSSIVDFGSETNISVGMTPTQEYLNAISMLFPLVALCYVYFVRDGHPPPSSFGEILGSPPLLVIASTTIHCPFSFIYHFRQGMQLDKVRRRGKAESKERKKS